MDLSFGGKTTSIFVNYCKFSRSYLCDFTFFLETHFVRKISVIQPCPRLRRSHLAQSKRLDLREISNGGFKHRTAALPYLLNNSILLCHLTKFLVSSLSWAGLS